MGNAAKFRFFFFGDVRVCLAMPCYFFRVPLIRGWTAPHSVMSMLSYAGRTPTTFSRDPRPDPSTGHAGGMFDFFRFNLPILLIFKRDHCLCEKHVIEPNGLKRRGHDMTLRWRDE